MKSKTIYCMLLMLILSSCAILPHYKEKRQDQKKLLYKNYSNEQIWDASLETIMQMNYTVREMDKLSGFLYGEGEEEALGWTAGAPLDQKMSVIIKKEQEDISVTCQVYSGVNKDPEKEIMKFFDLLSENLKKGGKG